MPRIYARTPVQDRLETHSQRIPFSGCWVWEGAADKQGYGRINIDRKAKLTHRVAYELAKGPIPDGLEIDHLCRVPACMNPDHLEPVTRKVNTDRGMCAEVHRARKAAIKVCKNGHPYTDQNTYIDKRGRRSCKECKANACKQYQERKKNGLK